jgi:hypothetical protein
MTRTTTAAPAPAPGNGRNGKPRNGKVRSITVPPEQLQEIDLSAPTLSLPAHLQAALQAAQASQPQKRQKQATPRVAMTAAELAAVEAMGWKAPYVTADLTVTPKPAQRGRNACKGATAYAAAAAVLVAGQPLTVPDLAALWLATNGTPKPLNALLQQISNRAGRVLQQSGATIAAV